MAVRSLELARLDLRDLDAIAKAGKTWDGRTIDDIQNNNKKWNGFLHRRRVMALFRRSPVMAVTPVTFDPEELG